MKLIIVEDDNDQITAYRDSISALNAEGDIQIEEPKIVGTLTDALSAIESENFDAAVVDLKLSNGQDYEGNDIIKQIVNIKRFPVFVYSAHLGDLDPAVPESFFFQKFEKTGTVLLRDILIKIRDIYKTGVTKILGRGGTIEKHLIDIFWKHVAESFDNLCRKGIDEKQLLRYITGHLYEYLELGETDGTFKKYLPEEVYIKPSIKSQFFTGSIIKEKNGDKKFIILTPQCDIVNKKAKHLLLASMGNLTENPIQDWKSKSSAEIPEALPEEQREARTEEKETAAEILQKVVNNNGPYKYYFLPPSSNFEGGLVNFQELESVESSNIGERFDIVAAVNSQFLKDIVAKFSFYYSRQGAPEIEVSIGDLP